MSHNNSKTIIMRPFAFLVSHHKCCQLSKGIYTNKNYTKQFSITNL